MTDGTSRPTRRVRRFQPDDPRVEESTRWLQHAGHPPALKEALKQAITNTLIEAGFFDVDEEVPEDEVRVTGVAEEVQSRQVSTLTWPAWFDLVQRHGLEGALNVAAQLGQLPPTD